MISLEPNLDSIKCGVACFNQGRYWHAHEEWERPWRVFTGREKATLQAYIFAAGALVLLQKGRTNPAQRLAARYFQKLQEGAGSSLFQRLQSDSLKKCMHRLLETDEVSDSRALQECMMAAQTVEIDFR